MTKRGERAVWRQSRDANNAARKHANRKEKQKRDSAKQRKFKSNLSFPGQTDRKPPELALLRFLLYVSSLWTRNKWENQRKKEQMWKSNENRGCSKKSSQRTCYGDSTVRTGQKTVCFPLFSMWFLEQNGKCICKSVCWCLFLCVSSFLPSFCSVFVRESDLFDRKRKRPTPASFFLLDFTFSFFVIFMFYLPFAECQISLSDKSISREHATIVLDAANWFVHQSGVLFFDLDILFLRDQGSRLSWTYWSDFCLWCCFCDRQVSFWHLHQRTTNHKRLGMLLIFSFSPSFLFFSLFFLYHRSSFCSCCSSWFPFLSFSFFFVSLLVSTDLLVVCFLICPPFQNFLFISSACGASFGCHPWVRDQSTYTPHHVCRTDRIQQWLVWEEEKDGTEGIGGRRGGRRRSRNPKSSTKLDLSPSPLPCLLSPLQIFLFVLIFSPSSALARVSSCCVLLLQAADRWSSDDRKSCEAVG